jgi:hypothetical protein
MTGPSGSKILSMSFRPWGVAPDGPEDKFAPEEIPAACIL